MFQHDIDTMISLGEQASQYPRFLDHFCYAFGQQVFQRELIADRIDFLIVAQKNSEDEVLDETIEIFHPNQKQDVIALNDLTGQFGLNPNTVLILMNNSEDGNVYSIRSSAKEFVQEVIGAQVTVNDKLYHNIVDDPSGFWNFTNFNEQIEIFKPSKVFLNLHLTRAAALMVIWASNRLGFVRTPIIE